MIILLEVLGQAKRSKNLNNLIWAYIASKKYESYKIRIIKKLLVKN